jgi:MoxR-like ATPase
VAYQLDLGKVLVWPITSRTTLQQGLYAYDAVARLHEASLAEYRETSPPSSAQGRRLKRRVVRGNKRTWNEPGEVGRYIRLGPLGTALLARTMPRVLLIDEIDKSDVDLPNDLLHVFEEGRFQIAELARLPRKEEYAEIEVYPFDSDEMVRVPRDRIQCDAFPFVVLTSNGERAFPPAFLRRCIRLHIREPKLQELTRIVESRLKPTPEKQQAVERLIEKFVSLRDTPTAEGKTDLATDQLLNAVHLLLRDYLPTLDSPVLDVVLRSLNEVPPDDA